MSDPDRGFQEPAPDRRLLLEKQCLALQLREPTYIGEAWLPCPERYLEPGHEPLVRALLACDKRSDIIPAVLEELDRQLESPLDPEWIGYLGTLADDGRVWSLSEARVAAALVNGESTEAEAAEGVQVAAALVKASAQKRAGPKEKTGATGRGAKERKEPDVEPSDESFDAADLLALPMAEPNFVVQPFIPEGTTIWCGRPKVGKTTALRQLAHAANTGGHFLGEVCAHTEVWFLSLEEGARLFRKKLAVMNLPVEGWRGITVDFKWPQGMEGVEKLRKRLSARTDRRPSWSSSTRCSGSGCPSPTEGMPSPRTTTR